MLIRNDLYATGSNGDRNDCAVRAVSVATGRPYAEVQAEMVKAGRPLRRRTYPETIDKVLDGQKLIRLPHKPTLGRFACMAEGSFVVWVRGHYVALTDGTVHDWQSLTSKRGRGGKRRVIGYWRV